MEPDVVSTSERPTPVIEFIEAAADFLAAAEAFLLVEPVVSTVVSTVASRAAAEIVDGIEQDPRHWYVVVRDDAGTVVGAGMRTAPFEPRPLFLLPMADDAAIALARALHERGEQVSGVNGVLPAARVCADELARLQGEHAAESQQTRLHVLETLVVPASPQGALRPATVEDVAICMEWFAAFGADADVQAGRAAGTGAHELPDLDAMLRRIKLGRVWLWEDTRGDVVHLTGATLPAFGVARVGPVYTPVEHRGRGYASAAVAAVSATILEAGAVACLFTDQANATSNKIYAALGYCRVADMANLSVG